MEKSNRKILSKWSPSSSAIDLIKLNGIDDELIARSRDYLKNQTEMNDIDDIEGYDNWDEFFIMFCIKANKKSPDDN